MKKVLYCVALAALCCPTVLSAQQVFAEGTPAYDAASSEAVQEAIENSLTELPEGTTETTESSELTEGTETTEESSTEDESSEETETTTEETTEEAEVPVETETTEEAVLPEVVEELAAEEVATQKVAAVTMKINFIHNGSLIHVEEIVGFDGEPWNMSAPKGYVVSSISDIRITSNNSAVSGSVQGYLSSDLTVLTVELSLPTDTSVVFNYVDDQNYIITGGYPVPYITGTPGEKYTFNPPEIRGYIYEGGPITGIFGNSGTELFHVKYTRLEYDLNIVCVDENGNQFYSETHRKKWDDHIWINPQIFSDRELIGFDDLLDIEGNPITANDFPYLYTFIIGGETLVFRYKTLSTIEELPGINNVVPPATIVQPVVHNNLAPEQVILPLTNTTTKTENQLPATGEESSAVALIVGTSMAAYAGFLLLKKKETE
ncbi:LPXTG cell wall anchor domain-containing protein [Enterococcus sp. LJL128]